MIAFQIGQDQKLFQTNLHQVCMAFQWTLGLEGLKRRILHDNGNYGRVNILTVITKIFKKFVPKQIIYEIGESMREIQDRSCREYERNP